LQGCLSTFLLLEKLQKKSQPDEDTGANTAFFARISISLRFKEKFFNAHYLCFTYVLHMVASGRQDANAKCENVMIKKIKRG
jgi:hypothetical protein